MPRIAGVVQESITRSRYPGVVIQQVIKLFFFMVSGAVIEESVLQRSRIVGRVGPGSVHTC